MKEISVAALVLLAALVLAALGGFYAHLFFYAARLGWRLL